MSYSKVKGGLPGVDWGDMYTRFIQRQSQDGSGPSADRTHLSGDDLEHCFFINHDSTGACCAVYRSLKQKLFVISFRGTCAPKDLITDATITQDAWVEGEDVNKQDIPKAHAGFRYVPLPLRPHPRLARPHP